MKSKQSAAMFSPWCTFMCIQRAYMKIRLTYTPPSEQHVRTSKRGMQFVRDEGVCNGRFGHTWPSWGEMYRNVVWKTAGTERIPLCLSPLKQANRRCHSACSCVLDHTHMHASVYPRQHAHANAHKQQLCKMSASDTLFLWCTNRSRS